MVDTTYYFDPNKESIDQYNTRISDYNASKNSISSNTLQQQEPLSLPDYQPEQPYDSTAIPTFDDILSQNDGTSQTEQTGNQLDNRFLSALGQLSGKQSAQYAAEDAAGLPAFQKQLTDVNSQLLTLQNEYKAIPLQAQQDATGRGVTAAGLAPITTAKLRNNAIQALGLSSIGATLQGNIALAEQQANRAVEVQFAPIEAEINYLREAIQINDKKLGREDQKKAQRMQLQLGERERLLNNAREDKKLIYGWAAEAFKNGAPAMLVQRAQSLNNPDAALSILGEYFVDKDAKAMALLDMDFKREQIKNAQYDRYIQGEDLKLRKDAAARDWTKLQQEADVAAGTSNEAVQTRIGAIDLVNNILTQDTSALTGFPNPLALTPARSTASNQINQLRAILALENRAKLKGSGAVSDYESRILNQSASALGKEGWLRSSNLSDKAFQSELKKVRGILSVMNGGTVTVKIQDPATGEIKRGTVDRAGLNKASQRGFVIIYE